MEIGNWVNYGDVNPMEHGGLWLLKDDEREHGFYVIKWEPIDDDNGFMHDGYVDTTDTWMSHQDVADFAGWDANTTIEQRTCDYFEYYGALNFGGEVRKMSRKDSVNYLHDREVFTDDDEAEELNEDQQMARLIEAGQVNPFPSEDYDDEVRVDYDEDEDEEE